MSRLNRLPKAKSEANRQPLTGIGDGGASQAQNGLSSVSKALSDRAKIALVSLFAATAFFSLIDLFTSFDAYRLGLVEGNTLLLGSSRLFGVSVFDALEGSKLAFVLGLGGVALMGAKSRDSFVRKVSFAMLATFAMVFALVSLNNLIAIGMV